LAPLPNNLILKRSIGAAKLGGFWGKSKRKYGGSSHAVLISSKGARSSNTVLISSKGTPDARQHHSILKRRFRASAEGWKSEQHVSSF
jgi:hypothetical protein